MTERETLEAAAGTLEQIYVLLLADIEAVDQKIAALSAFPNQLVPRSETDSLSQSRDVLKKAAFRNRIAFNRITAKLDPLGDLYLFQPAELVTLTPGGVVAKTTGFCNYLDPVTVQAIAADTPTILEINPVTINEAQKPADIVTFFSGGRIRAGEGDAIDIRAQITVRPSDENNTATTISTWLVMGDLTTIRVFPDNNTLDGFDVAKTIAYNTTAYIGNTWANEGARIMVQADGPVEVTSRTLLVTRLHKGR